MRNLKLQRVECQIHPGYKAETWASKMWAAEQQLHVLVKASICFTQCMISFWAGKGSGYPLSQPDQQGLKEAMFPSKNAKYTENVDFWRENSIIVKWNFWGLHILFQSSDKLGEFQCKEQTFSYPVVGATFATTTGSSTSLSFCRCCSRNILWKVHPLSLKPDLASHISYHVSSLLWLSQRTEKPRIWWWSLVLLIVTLGWPELFDWALLCMVDSLYDTS